MVGTSNQPATSQVTDIPNIGALFSSPPGSKTQKEITQAPPPTKAATVWKATFKQDTVRYFVNE